MLNAPLNVVQLIQNASDGSLCAAHFHWPRGFVHEKHTPAACWEGAPRSYRFSFSCASQEHRYQSRHDTFARLQSCLQLIHTRNMLMLPFMVYLFYFPKPNFVSIHCCSLGQHCQLIACMLRVQYKIHNVTSVGLSSERAGNANA